MDDPVSFLQQVVRRHDVLGIIVANRLQRPVFPILGCFAGQDSEGDLYV